MKPSFILLFLGAALCLGAPLAAGDSPEAHEGIPPMMMAVLEEAGYGDSTADLLRAATAAEDSAVRGIALEALGYRDDPAAVATLESVAESTDQSELRLAAASALARLGREQGLQIMVALLNDSDRYIQRPYLAKRLAEEGNSAGYGLVLELLADGASGEELEILAAFVPLAERDGLDAGERLLAHGNSEDAEIRRVVLSLVGGLGRHGAALVGARELLENAAATDPVELNRWTAAYVLESWSQAGKGGS